MQATLNICSNPFHPTLDRVQKPIGRKLKINTLVQKYQIDLTKPVICYLNGAPLLRNKWGKTLVKDGDVISFVYLPQGGGGSNPLRLILTIGLMTFAPYLATSMGFAAGSIGAQLMTAGIGMLGNMLINALIPPPKTTNSQRNASLAAPSPTYSIGAQGNQARIGQAIPVLYGTMRIFPDFAAQPFAEYENNDQYLYQLFVITQGKAALTEINIEDSPITSFGSDYELEIIAPNTHSSLYPTEVYNVSEVSGQELLTDSIGPFVVNPSGTNVNKLAFDIVLPKGLGYINDNGGIDSRTVTFKFFAQAVNALGVATGASVEIGSESVSGATNTAIRKTYKYAIAAGRYRIAVLRTSAKDTDSRTSNDLNWASARGYSSVVTNYGNLTMLAVKLKATNSISSASSRKINVLATRQLAHPTFNVATQSYDWSAEQSTQSIAWAVADMCRAEYGAGLTDNRYNLAQLIALDTVFSSRGDTFNGLFDSVQTFWDALSMATRTGRTRPYVQGGLIHYVRDSLQTLPTAMFTNRNMVKDSFKLTYIMPSEDNADCVDVEYFDESLWKPRVVRAALDAGTPTKPAKVKAFGITNRDQAYREGMYIAASNRYRRKEISFETELEGHIPSLGDLVGIQSDIPEWGQSGEVVSVQVISPTSHKITSNEPFVWSPSATHFMMLRRANGSAAGPITVTQGANDFELLYNPSAVDFTINVGLDKERTHISFGRSGQVIQLARILSTTPSDNRVRITAINEDARVHAADGTAVPIDTYSWSLTTPKIKPILTDFTISQTGSGNTPSLALSWAPAAGASYYVIEQSTDDENWSTLGEITGNSYNFLAASIGTLYVRVAAFGGVLGPYITKSITIGLVPPPANVVTGTISANGQTYEVKWDAVTDCDGYFVEVLNAGSVKRAFNTLATNYAYTLENALADGGPWRAVTVRIKAYKGTVKSVTALTLNGANAAPTAPILTIVPGANNISVTVSKSSEGDYLGTLIHASTSAGFTPNSGNVVYDGTSNFYLAQTTSTLYFKAAHYDTYGTTGLNYSAEYSSTPNSSGGGIMSVSVLPAPVDNGLVYLTTDDQIYTSDGIAWTAAGSVIADGSITGPKIATNAIDATKIQAGAIIASKITVANLSAITANMGAITSGSYTVDNAGFIRGGQTAYATGTGFFMGFSGADYKFSLGNATKGVTWDGASFTIKGDLIAGSININNRFIVAADGTTTIKSATTGARLEMVNDVIRVYDASNVVRIKMGNLA
ncbi:MAG: host specificity factor TipJ family phage tail protein [Methylotenera sp.]